MNRKSWIVGVFSLGLLLTSCNDDSFDKNVEIFFDRVETAEELNQAVYDAIELADTDVAKSILEFDNLCPKANRFMESQFGEDGWEYPGDFPEEYGPFKTAMTASIYSCYFEEPLREKRWGTFARYSAQFLQYYKCLVNSAFFSNTDACPPYGLFAE